MDILITVKCAGICRFHHCFMPEEEGAEFQKGDDCIIQIEKGQLLGKVTKNIEVIKKHPVDTEECRIIRKATIDDLEQYQKNKELEQTAYQICETKIEEHVLPMKLVKVEYLFDQSRATFYFTADGRVDFRNLVRDLAYELRIRIEMKQIGVRDEARLIGGLGLCGRMLCCASFLGDFAPISIRMAKIQNLPLDPAKISGLCGRLMCCLEYECSTYEKIRKGLPRIGERVILNGEEGKVRAHEVLNETVVVEFPDGRVLKQKAKDLKIKQRK